jgi:hypothetical protein
MACSGAAAFSARLEMVDERLKRRGFAVPVAVAVLLAPEGRPGRRLPVCGDVNGIPFRSTLALRDDGLFVLTLNASLRTKAGVEIGDTARIRLAPDAEPREVEPPADLRAALRASPRAAAAFAVLSPSHQKEYVDWLGQVKRPETRAHRIEKMLGVLVEPAGAADGTGNDPPDGRSHSS